MLLLKLLMRRVQFSYIFHIDIFINFMDCFRFFLGGKGSSTPPRVSLRRMQLFYFEGGFGIFDLCQYHQAYLLSSTNYWEHFPNTDTPSWAYLEASYLIPHSKWTVLGSDWLKEAGALSTVTSVRYLWSITAGKYKFGPYSHDQLTLWVNPGLRIGRKPFLLNA